MVKHAMDYQIDPQRIAIFGSSAGGHLSLVTALGKPRDFPGDPALAGYDPPALRGEVAFYPATDFSDASLESSASFVQPASTYEDKLTSSIASTIIRTFVAPAIRNIPSVIAESSA